MAPRTESATHEIVSPLPEVAFVSPNTIPSVETPKELNMARAIILSEVNGQTCALLLQRSEGSFDAGKFELPGGKIDPGETVAESIVREVAEETGLQITLPDQLDMQSTRVMKGGKYDGVPANTYLQIALTDGYEVSHSPEHTTSLWCTRDEIKEMAARGELAATSKEALMNFVNL